MVGNDIACDILIRHFRRLGLNIEAMNDEGFTALLMAAKHGNITCAQILVGQGKAVTTHRDIKYGLTVEEWLAKKGFTLQDIKPVRQDGKGRSRFVKLANIAAICSAPKKQSQASQGYGDIDYALNNFTLGKLEDEDGFFSDATTGTDLSTDSISRYLARYNERYNDLDLDFAHKHYKIYPYRQAGRPKLKTQATQTEGEDGEYDENDDEEEEEEDDDDNTTVFTMAETMKSDAQTDITDLHHDPRIHLERSKKTGGNKQTSPEDKARNARSMEKIHETDSKSKGKRFSLPEIEHTPIVSRTDNDKAGSERKKSLDVLPEKLIANIDLGDGRRHSIQLHTDSVTKKVYWSPVNDDRSDAGDDGSLMPLKFDRAREVSDSETSTNDDGPIF